MLRDAIGVELHCLTRAEGAPGPLLVTNGGDVFESPEGFRGAVGNWRPWPFKTSVESAAKVYARVINVEAWLLKANRANAWF